MSCQYLYNTYALSKELSQRGRNVCFLLTVCGLLTPETRGNNSVDDRSPAAPAMPRSSTSLEQNASRWVLWQPTRARVTTPRVAHLISGEPTTARGEPRAAPHSCGHQRGSTSAPRDRHGAWPAREFAAASSGHSLRSPEPPWWWSVVQQPRKASRGSQLLVVRTV